MIKTTITLIGIAGVGLGATTAPAVTGKYNPVTAVDMQISHLDIAAKTEEGLSLNVTEDSDFAIRLKLRNGHTIKVGF